MFREVDKAKSKVYDEAEVKFLERLEAREYKHQQKMKEVEENVRAEFTKGDMFNARQQFYWAFDKWRMLTLMSKLQALSSKGEEITGSFVQDTVTNLLQRQKKDLIEEVNELKTALATSREETKKAETDSIRNE